jgi:hypothetical protein
MATKYADIYSVIAVILALAFGFSYKFEGPATLDNWFGTFIIVLILVAISILVHELAHKVVATKFMADVKPQIWFSGIIIMLLVLFVSNGAIVFTAIWAVSIIPLRLFRSNRTWPHLGPREGAVIALAGLLANLGLAVVAKLLVPTFGDLATKLMVINLSIALFNLIPFFTVLPVLAIQRFRETKLNSPYIEGEFIFFGSRTGWVFLLVFALVLSGGLLVFGATASVFLALVLALVLFVAWHYFFEPENLTIMDKTTSPSFRKFK